MRIYWYTGTKLKRRWCEDRRVIVANGDACDMKKISLKKL